MSIKLKPIAEQVIFITGATSVAGLATILSATKKGAKVFMAARDEVALDKIQTQMRNKKFSSAYAVIDESEVDQLNMAVDQCLATFGTIDSWINCVDHVIFSEFDRRKIFTDLFWSIVNGSKVASGLLAKNGGSIVNVSPLMDDDDLTYPLGHAIAGHSSSLQKELKDQKLPVFVHSVMENIEPEITSKLILSKCERRSFGINFPKFRDKIIHWKISQKTELN